MKKRCFTILLALCLFVSLLPSAAFAAEQQTHDGITFSDVGLYTTYTKSKNIFLTKDVEQGTNITITGKNTVVNLCLNGKTLHLKTEKMISVEDGATLNIYDCAAADAAGKITGGVKEKEGLIMVSGGTVNLYGGTVENTNVFGNAICVGQNSALYVSGGTVRKDAEITDCGGSAILCASGGSVCVTGGEVSCTSVSTDCYAISHMGGTLTIGGTAAVSNTGAGSAVLMHSSEISAEAHITGGTITAQRSAAIRLQRSLHDGRINTVFLSGAPTISGGAGQADVLLDKSTDKLYATAGTDSGSERYTGEALLIGAKSCQMGETIVRNTEDTGRFRLLTEKQDAALVPCDGNLAAAAPHVHSWSGDWSCDEAAHWHACTDPVCTLADNTQMEGFGAHSADGDGDCTTADVCAVCGYEFAAAEAHSLQYCADENVLIETCRNAGCAHRETAALTAPEGMLVYDGRAQFDALLRCSDGWQGEKPEISYLKNEIEASDTTGAGSYEAVICAGGAKASVRYTVQKAARETPEALSGSPTSSADAADGRITGLNGTMEYRKDGEAAYRVVTGEAVTGLSAGTYYVRYAETENFEASGDCEIVIAKGGKLAVEVSISKNFDKVYDGLPVVTGTDDYRYSGDGEVVIRWYEDQNGAQGEEMPAAPADAGAYWLGVSAAEGERYQAAGEVTIPVTIDPKEVEIEWAEDNFTYNGEDQAENVTALYRDVDGKNVKLTTSAAGEFRNYSEDGYVFKAAFAAGERNYRLPEAATRVYHMKRAKPAAIEFPTAGAITYGDALSAAVLTGGAGDGTFNWKDDTAIPTVHHGGYVVVFYPRDAENYDYGGVTLEKTLPVSVGKAKPTYTLPENLTAIYGQTLAEVKLPVGWAWDEPAQSVGSVGENQFNATFTPDDAGNYEAVTETLSVTVGKAKPTYTMPENLTATYGQTLAEVKLPVGWTWNEPAQSVGSVGENQFNATFTPDDAGNYEAVTETLSVAVGKAKPTCTLPENLTAIYGQTLAEVKLPVGWAWDKPAQSVGSVGTNEFNATFTPADAENYEAVTETLSVAVGKAKPTYTLPEGLTATYGQTLAEVKLPVGWTWDEPAQSVGSVGTNEFNATFTPADAGNYEAVTETLSVTVGKSKPTYTLPENLTATYGQTLAEVKLPVGWAWDEPAQSVGSVGENQFSATFTPDDTGNYEAVTETLSVAVGKAKPTYTLPEDLKAVYGQTLAEVKLPVGWAWDKPAQSVGSVGTNEFNATFTPDDAGNYEAVTETLSVTVGKAKPTYTMPENLTATYGQTLAEVKLPVGWTWDEPAQSVGSVGTNEFNATFTPADAGNYEAVTETLSVAVGRAKPTYTLPENLTATYGQTLAEVKLPVGWTWDEPAQSVGSVGENQFSATFTPADAENDQTVSVEVTIRVTQRTPLLRSAPTASAIGAGSQLSVSALTGGTVEGINGSALKGTWSWQNAREMTGTGTFRETAVFTPDDANYAPLAAEAAVTVYGAGSGAEEPAEPGMPHEAPKISGTRQTAPKNTSRTNAFSDVDKAAWYFDAVEYVREKGLMGGVGGGKFCPEGEMTRGMIVTILYRMAGSPRVRSDGAAWWSDARVWAMAHGISDGADMVGSLTREQLAVMLYRCANAAGANVRAKGSLRRFPDRAGVSIWAKDAMRWAVDAGIVGGRSGGVLDPKGRATRAEAAAMLSRFERQ